MKLCKKNYENQSIFVKVTARKSVAPFLFGHDAVFNNLSRCQKLDLSGTFGLGLGSRFVTFQIYSCKLKLIWARNGSV